MSKDRTFTWLHLSDLHVGMTDQNWMWPSVKHAFLTDLRTLVPRVGGLDLVIFSGDLTQRADRKEFAKLDVILKEIRDTLSEAGCEAPILVVPGNHDLVRPRDKSSASILLNRWWEESDGRESFWTNNSDMSRLVKRAFKPFSDWAAKQPWIAHGIDVSMGVLPGDFSCSVDVGAVKVGVVGLNSAWLQLSDGDYERRLHVDPRQIQGVTDSDPGRWRDSHDIALLVTHHPTSWLHPNSLEQWKSEIDPPGRFDAHLFGHMHIPDTQTVAQAGSVPRTSMQAASVFGLEYFGGGAQKRIHGYSITRIKLKASSRVRTVWPRILQRHLSGKLRFIADQTFELNEENFFDEEYYVGQSQNRVEWDTARPREMSPTTETDVQVLEAIRYRLDPSPAHAFVRLPEQATCAKALLADRSAWIQAEWGLGADGFVWSVLKKMQHEDASVYRIDFGDFRTRDEFLDSIKRTTGSTFEKLCALIARQANAYIIFDNVDSRSGQDIDVVEEAENIADVVLDYCPDASVFIRSRSAPPESKRPIKLRPLEEPDTSIYVLHAPLGGKQLSLSENAAKLHKITDGAPGRLDAALRDLRIVGLDELVAHNTDYEAPAETVEGAPETLTRAIADLRDSEDPQIVRSFDLLKTLTALPQGEQLEAVERFNNAYPFFLRHANELLDRGLIDAQPISEVAPSNPGAELRILTVSRSVREYIRSQMQPDDLRRLDERALELYFGPDWKSGDITSPVGRRFSEPLQHGYKIANANALLMRLLRRADEGSDDDMLVAFRVISSYFAALLTGSHYRSVVALASELAPHLDEEKFEREAALIKVQYARSLRMTSESARARDILEGVNVSLLGRDARRSALLNLALCYEKLGDDRAKDVAAAVVKLGRSEAAALHAQAIIVGQTETGATRLTKLREIEEQAKKKKFFILANNLVLDRLDEEDLSDSEMDKLLSDVLSRAKEGKDFYNGVRAIVKISTALLKRGENLSEQQTNRLIEAYHFLFNERLTGMFDKCHSALWTQFEHSADVENLLRLFRHSSLIWRLRDTGDEEARYVKRLGPKVKPQSNVSTMLPRETAYFLARTTAVLAKQSRSGQKRISASK